MSKFRVNDRVSYHGLIGTVLEVRGSSYVVHFDTDDLILTPYESDLVAAKGNSPEWRDDEADVHRDPPVKLPAKDDLSLT